MKIYKNLEDFVRWRARINELKLLVPDLKHKIHRKSAQVKSGFKPQSELDELKVLVESYIVEFNALAAFWHEEIRYCGVVIEDGLKRHITPVFDNRGDVMRTRNRIQNDLRRAGKLNRKSAQFYRLESKEFPDVGYTIRLRLT